MVTVKSLITGAVALIVTLACAESAVAHRMQERVRDARTGRMVRVAVAHRHTSRGRVVVLNQERSTGVFGTRPGIALGNPVAQYQTYTTSNPYARGSYRYEDREGFRYYRDDNGSVLGRVLQSVVLGASQSR